MKNRESTAVAPVVATVLLLGLTISLAALASFTLFDSFDGGEEPKVEINVFQETNQSNIDKRDLTVTVVKPGNTESITVDVLSGDSKDDSMLSTVGNRTVVQNLPIRTNVQILAKTGDGSQAIIQEETVR